ncbi:MAG TPA: DUF6174 domain-containing protein [Vicinamibacteria bacterium]|nr:DUF6174 domain-containing protein [Vicinamibacteria bacterium]
MLTREALQEAQSRWQSRAVPSYTIEVFVSGEMFRHILVEVRDGEIGAATMIEDGEGRIVEGHLARPYTVEGLFRTLSEEIKTSQRQFVRARFHPTLGFPELIELGPLRSAPGATPWVIRVESFRPAPESIEPLFEDSIRTRFTKLYTADKLPKTRVANFGMRIAMERDLG